MACYKLYITSQPLGNHQETEPVGLFRSSLSMFLLQRSPYGLPTVKHSYQLTGSQLLLQELSRSPFSYDFNKATCGKMLWYCHHAHNEITAVCSSSKRPTADLSQSVREAKRYTCQCSHVPHIRDIDFFLATWRWTSSRATASAIAIVTAAQHHLPPDPQSQAQVWRDRSLPNDFTLKAECSCWREGGEKANTG